MRFGELISIAEGSFANFAERWNHPSVTVRWAGVVISVGQSPSPCIRQWFECARSANPETIAQYRPPMCSLDQAIRPLQIRCIVPRPPPAIQL